jgi:effector-binding domain-containing protein
MKKLIIGISVLLLVALIMLWLISFNIKKQVTIRASIFNVANQITNLRNWNHWHPQLKGRDTASFNYSKQTNVVNSFLDFKGQTYTITNVNSQGIEFETKTDNDKNYQSIAAYPDSFLTITNVTWTKKIHLITWFKEKFNQGSEMERGLKNLKEFMEDPRKFYGFHIEIQPVVDTLVITKKAIANKNNIPVSLQNLYKDLFHYLQENNMSYGNRLAGFANSTDSTIEVMAGICVDTKIPAKTGIEYLEMPAQGRMLVGEYAGPYNKITSLYNAMNQYMEDKGLQKVAMIYEKYLSEPHTGEDSMNMKVRIYYPIY